MGGRRKPGKVKLRRDYAGRVAYTALYVPGPGEDYVSAGTFDTLQGRGPLDPSGGVPAPRYPCGSAQGPDHVPGFRAAVG